MWDWEIISYLKGEGIATIAPYDLAQTRKVCNALRVKRELRETKFLVYQDNPGEGAQASIFKRFFWWEDECTQRMKDKFGVTIVKRSLRDLEADPTIRAVGINCLGELPARGALRLPGRHPAVLRHRMDAPQEGAGHRGRQRDGD